MAGISSFFKSLFGIKHVPTPREMAEAQIRQIEQAIMEYNSKDRTLRRDKALAVQAGKEADAQLKQKRDALDALPDDDESLERDSLLSEIDLLEETVNNTKSQMDMADAGILQNRRLLDGAQKALIRLRSALETNLPVEELAKLVQSIAQAGDRYDTLVDGVVSDIGSLEGMGTNIVRSNRERIAAESAERKRKKQNAAQHASSQPGTSEASPRAKSPGQL